MDQNYIGVLDSGLGGLTILKELADALPNENFIYLGDNQRAPYGNRSHEEIKKFTEEMVTFLQKHSIKMLVLACNTITAEVQIYLESSLDIPVVGVIQPAAEAALNLTENGKIGVIATEKTVESQAYQDIFKEKGLDEVDVKPCQKLVDLVEENKMGTREAYREVAACLEPYSETEIDTLVLGCTHFPYLEKEIEHFFEGKNKVKLVHAGSIIPSDVYKVLEKRGQLGEPAKTRKIDLYTTGNLKDFEEVASTYLGDKQEMTFSKTELGRKLEAE